MKKLFTAIVLGIALAGAALAQNSTGAGSRNEVKIAVVEFTPGANASAMTPDVKRQLQANIASALAKTDVYDLADVRWTRNESADNLAELNGGSSTAAAVKLGKVLGVKYVLTGTVVEYTPKGADNRGRVVLKTRFIEVATGKVKHTSEITQQGKDEMRTTGYPEMQAKVIKPAIEKLTAEMIGLKF